MTLSPAQDTWVNKASPSTNHNASTTLALRGAAGVFDEKHVILRFESPNADHIERADLVLRYYNVNVDNTLDVSLVAANTNVGGLTWYNRPTAAHLIRSVPIKAGSGIIRIDVRRALTPGRATVLRLSLRDAGWGNFYSKNYSYEPYRPKIELTHAYGRIVIRPGPEHGVDSWTNKADPGANFGTTGHLALRNVGASDEKRVFMRFPIPEVCQIQRAELRLHFANNPWDADISAHLVNGSWDEGTITWNNQPPLGTELAQVSIDENSGQLLFDVTTGVQPSSNLDLGIVMRGDYDWAHFWSSDHADENMRPALVIDYDPRSCDEPSGLTPQMHAARLTVLRQGTGTVIVGYENTSDEGGVLARKIPGLSTLSGFNMSWGSVYNYGTATRYVDIAAIDTDGDGNDELALLRSNDRAIVIFELSSDGTTLTARDRELVCSGSCDVLSLASGAFHAPSVASVGVLTSQLGWHYVNGQWTYYASPWTLVHGFQGLSSKTIARYGPAVTMPAGTWGSLGYADLEGDGYDGPVLVDTRSGRVAYSEYYFNGSFNAVGDLPGHGSSWGDVVAHDPDGDGVDHLVVQHGMTGNLAVLRRHGASLRGHRRRVRGNQYSAQGLGVAGTTLFNFVYDRSGRGDSSTGPRFAQFIPTVGAIVYLPLVLGLAVAHNLYEEEEICAYTYGQIMGQTETIPLPGKVFIRPEYNDWWADEITADDNGAACDTFPYSEWGDDEQRVYYIELMSGGPFDDSYDPYDSNCIRWAYDNNVDRQVNGTSVTFTLHQEQEPYASSTCNNGYSLRIDVPWGWRSGKVAMRLVDTGETLWVEPFYGDDPRWYWGWIPPNQRVEVRFFGGVGPPQQNVACPWTPVHLPEDANSYHAWQTVTIPNPGSSCDPYYYGDL